MMKGNIGRLMQQAQKMQENLKKAQSELGDLEVVGESGGGLVRVWMNGRHAVRRVAIDPAAGGDLEMLEDLITAAINDAVQRVQKLIEERMSEVTGGMPMPPGFGF